MLLIMKGWRTTFTLSIMQLNAVTLMFPLLVALILRLLVLPVRSLVQLLVMAKEFIADCKTIDKPKSKSNAHSLMLTLQHNNHVTDGCMHRQTDRQTYQRINVSTWCRVDLVFHLAFVDKNNENPLSKQTHTLQNHTQRRTYHETHKHTHDYCSLILVDDALSQARKNYRIPLYKSMRVCIYAFLWRM